MAGRTDSEEEGVRGVAAGVGDNEKRQEASMITRDEVLSMVKRHLMDNVEDLNEGAIDPNKSMKELGANSLDVVEVVSCAMRDLKVKVPRAELAQLTNMNGLVDLLYQYSCQKRVAQA